MKGENSAISQTRRRRSDLSLTRPIRQHDAITQDDAIAQHDSIAKDHAEAIDFLPLENKVVPVA